MSISVFTIVHKLQVRGILRAWNAVRQAEADAAAADYTRLGVQAGAVVFPYQVSDVL
jgi:hypothetical protein